MAATYLIHGRLLASDGPGFEAALAAAHAGRHRPRCLCLPDGAPMYVAKLASGFVVKRMPSTACQHAHDCPSGNTSGRPGDTGTRKDPAGGGKATALRLGSAMSTGAERASGRRARSRSLAARAPRLSLRDLLFLLWDEAELTTWQPGFEGRRSWAVVRRHLLRAVRGKTIAGEALLDRLYIPEVFIAERRSEIAKRRTAHWQHATRLSRSGRRRLMLLIGEFKAITSDASGAKFRIKHMPDWPLAAREGATASFAEELRLRNAHDSVRLILIATIARNKNDAPAIVELDLVPTTEWIPVTSEPGLELLRRLIRGRRTFTWAPCEDARMQSRHTCGSHEDALASL